MKILLAVVLFAFATSFGQACGDRTCDDAAIKAIFDANSLTYNNANGDIANLTGRVTVLNLIGPGFKTIPGSIGRLIQLHDLTILNTSVTSLPPEIGLVKSVRNVVIMENRLLTSLPSEIGNWGANSTKIVKLDRNGLTYLPSTIGNWTELEALSASGNKLITVPKEIEKFDHGYFQRIDLSNNLIDSLPIEIGGIANLRTLLLNNNKLTKFPAGIFNLSILSTLDLSNNLITTIPPAIGTRKTLTELNLSGNKIITLPTEISGASLLKKLLLNDNQIATLPSVLWNLTSLIYLELKGNQISTISAEVSKLKALQRLMLSRNQLTDLPATISTLTSLYGMEIGYNRLCTLPTAVVTWANLNSIDSVPWLSTQTKNGTTSCTGVSTLEQESPSESYRMTKNIREHSITFFHKEGPSELSVFSTTGKLLTSSTSIKNPVTFNYGPLPKGIYLVQFKSKSETRLQKLVLE